MFNSYKRPLLAATGVLIVLSLLAWSYAGTLRATRESAAREVVGAFSQRLVERFHQTIAPVFIIAGRVDPKSGVVRDFEDSAAEISRSFPLVRAVELAPGGIVSYVYPLSGNEKIVGHDLLKDRERNKEAWVAVSRREMAVAGPFELKQGGLGAIARYPLYRALPDGRQSFWGFSIIVVDFPSLLRVAGVAELERAGYLFQFCWVPNAESACRTTLGDELPASLEPVRTNLQLSSADWRIAVAPATGWVSGAEWTLLSVLIALISGFIGAAVHWFAQPRGSDGEAELTTPAG